MNRASDFAELVGDVPAEPIPAELTTREAADLFGVEIRTIQSLLAKQVLHRTALGDLDTRESVRAYLAFCRRGASTTLETEKLRLTREQADKIEIQNATARRELLPAAEVEREWSSALRDLRAALLALPPRVQQRLPHLTAHDMQTLDREIRDVLTELADHD